MTDRQFDFDYLVIGSGFGGIVSAMRLSQKGYRVGVIEAGKQWKNDDFARVNWNLRKFLWMPKIFLYGIQRMNLLTPPDTLTDSACAWGEDIVTMDIDFAENQI